MDDQTTLNGSPRRERSRHAMAQNLAGIAHDLLTISDLQMRLFADDLRALRNRVLRALAIWLIAYGLLVAALPTALIGGGFWLADMTHLSSAAGLLVISFGALLLVAGLFVVGWWQITRQRSELQRSRNELHNNWVAIRQLLSSYAGRDSAD
jgi:hypothetical protein